MVVPRRKPRQIDQRIEKDIRQIEFLLVTPIKHFALLLGTGLVCYYYSVWYGILMMLAQLFSLFQDAASLRQQQNVRLLWGLLKKPTTIAMITGLVITGLTFRVLTSIRPGYSFGLVVSLTTIIIVMGLYWIFWMR
ncbi:MAG: hypothetical protein HJJLKODD_02412 [Phycisphaerae bacterium]|nr:hypothetical protein [Phycisphaerae bacterium]